MSKSRNAHCSVCGKSVWKSHGPQICRDCRSTGAFRKGPALSKIATKCAWCGDMYFAPKRNPGSKFCSNSCKGRAGAEARRKHLTPEAKAEALRLKNDRRHSKRRAQLAAVEFEDFDRVEVFRRDGWKCQLCGRKVDSSLKSPDPMSASLDHIVPVSVGGAHTRLNTQLAHLHCNISKGNRGGGEQLLLVG